MESALTRGVAGRVALSFDDGPDPEWTPAVLDALATADARATFFVRRPFLPHPLARILAEGHEVGYHCGLHVRHSERNEEEVRAEAREDLAALADLGIEPTLWRTPWGDLAPWSAALADELGLTLTGWSDDTEDWAGHSSERMLDRLSRELEPGAIVLMHDGIGPGATRPGCAETVALIGPLAALVRERGLEPGQIELAEMAHAR